MRHELISLLDVGTQYRNNEEHTLNTIKSGLLCVDRGTLEQFDKVGRIRNFGRLHQYVYSGLRILRYDPTTYSNVTRFSRENPEFPALGFDGGRGIHWLTRLLLSRHIRMRDTTSYGTLDRVTRKG